MVFLLVAYLNVQMLGSTYTWYTKSNDNIARGSCDPVIIISITKITEGGYYNDHSGCRASGWAPPQNHKCFRNNYSANERPQSRLPWRQPLGSFHVLLATSFFNWRFLFVMEFGEKLYSNNVKQQLVFLNR